MIIDGQHTETPLSLQQIPAGGSCTVMRTDLDAEDGDLLESMGLCPECTLEVCRNRGLCVVRVNGTRLALSSEVARRIVVSVS